MVLVPWENYRWDNDWPRIGWERIEIGRDTSDGMVSRPIFAEHPRFYFQKDAYTPRSEITADEYARISAEWDAKRAAAFGEHEETKPRD